jgi:hypothetical protein
VAAERFPLTLLLNTLLLGLSFLETPEKAANTTIFDGAEWKPPPSYLRQPNSRYIDSNRRTRTNSTRAGNSPPATMYR